MIGNIDMQREDKLICQRCAEAAHWLVDVDGELLMLCDRHYQETVKKAKPGNPHE
jgi:hypothetical protein